MLTRILFKYVSVTLFSLAMVCVCALESFAGEEVTGIVNESGMGSIILSPEGSSEGIRYHIGRETIYTPGDYRAVAGDIVTITFYEKTLRGGSNILAVSTMKLKQKDPDRKAFVSPAQGVIREVGRAKIRISYPEYQITKSLSKKRGCEYEPTGYVPRVGDNVEVYFEKVVNRWTGRTNEVISRIIKK